jgi:hypothetical protein
MVLRIRLGRPSRVRRQGRKNRRVALAMAALLTPASLMAFALAFWRIAADLKWAGEFAIAHGMFSHWQVWIAMAFLLQGCAILLNRYGSATGEY